MKLTPKKAVAEPSFKRSFLFDILSFMYWRKLLYNSTQASQILFSRGMHNSCQFRQ